jgi:hypothetical protein
VSRSDLVDNIDDTGCCDRFFGQVVVIGYFYRFGAWLMHLFMVQVEVHASAWLMHFFMVQIDYMLFGIGYLVQVDWYRFTTVRKSLCGFLPLWVST